MARSHLLTTDAPPLDNLPLCGESRARWFSNTPTCRWCMKIQAGARRPADPIETAGKLGRDVN